MDLVRISILDTLIIVAYFIGIVSLGIWISKSKVKSGEDLFLAGRDSSWPVLGASLFSTNISSQQFVGQAGLAFSVGIVAGAFQMVGALAFTFLAMFFLEAYMGLRLYTSPEFFEKRYSRGSRSFVSGINMLMMVSANVAAALYAGATVLTVILGWDSNTLFWTAVIVLAATTGAYTVLGGLRSVLWTDFAQTFILVVGGVVTLVVSIAAAGGIDQVLMLKDSQGMSMWSMYRPWNHDFGWLPFVTGVIILGVHGHCTDHDYVQRALAAKSLYHAKMGAIFAAFLKVLALFIIAAPGVVAASLFPNLQNGDAAYARIIVEFMPIGLKGLVLAGLIAAIMSSVSSGLNATAALITFDFIGKRKPDMTDEQTVKIGRYLMIGILLICTVWAPFIRDFKGLFNYLLQVWALIAPPVFVTVIFGLFYKKANSKGAIATLTVGSVLGAITFAILNMAALAQVKANLPIYFQNKLNDGFIITLICVAVMLIVSHYTGSTPEDLAKAEAIRHSKTTEKMTDEENKKFRYVLIGLLVFWLAVLILFSPLGLGS
ncbi:MAG: sodium/solute symporter [FCB group bacterium]|nr:sodium/solute symporter [FCB group bacterium]MBL7120368.1 sodium/solute symporter [Candidatus Neomarinimicrobiota bacterium]